MSAEIFAKIVTGQETPSSWIQWFAFLLDKYGPWFLVAVAAGFFYNDLRENHHQLMIAYRESSNAMSEFSKSVSDLSDSVKNQSQSIERAHQRALNK